MVVILPFVLDHLQTSLDGDDHRVRALLQFASEDELLAQLRPGVDGLILHFHHCRATFLPAVWEQLPDPYVFLAQLKQKAGLPMDFWSPELQAERYTAEYFSE